MALRFPFASVPFLLRSLQTDEHYSKKLQDQLQTALTLVRGGRFVSQYEDAISVAAEAAYYYCTLVVTGQTLGDEYMELLPVVGTSGRPLRWVVLHVLMRALIPLIMRRLASRMLPDASPSTVVHHVNLFHTGIFFLFGAYPSIAHRLSNVRYLALRQPSQNELTPTGDVRRVTVYTLLGVLLVVQQAILFAKWYRARRAASRAAGRGGAGQPSSTAPVAQADEAEDGVDRGRCTLCLCDRRMPAATRCGHIFCWECIMRWFESSQQASPICPNCRQPASAQSVVLLANYKIHSDDAAAEA
jgi:hypothetical protein